MSGPIARAARAGDYEALYGAPLRHTIWAETAELDGRVVGIGGIAYVDGKPMLFSRVTDELRPFKRFIVRWAHHAAQMAKATNALALANPEEPLSCKLLQRIGLQWCGTMPEGEVFGWVRH
jgi:hypothetical protein